jgi:hypothetical protein
MATLIRFTRLLMTAAIMLAAPFALQAARPAITGITPAVVYLGSSAFTLTITGTGFDSNCVVKFAAGQTVTPTAYTATQISITVTPAMIPNAGSYDVSVLHAVDGLSNAVTLAVQLPTPVLTRLNSAAVAAGSPSFSIFAWASGLTSTTTMMWNGAPLTSASSPASGYISGAVPAEYVATQGSASITLVNSGNPTPSNAFTFRIVEPALISSLSPLPRPLAAQTCG